jgi:3-methylcrotonyl-CoA carboxylase beta subunit
MILETGLNPRSAEFKANAERMRGLVEDLKQKVALVCVGGDAEAREKLLKRCKLLPRVRVRRLLDPV